MNYYNEFDPHAAQWLRNLIEVGAIPPGFVDTRSIEDVAPNELAGYTQCHFFAGIGGWVYALDLAGWPRDRPVWTGSCPCQPFSAAGKGAGFEDERHLWPAWQHLIAQCRPAVVFGEQVASKAVDAWIDLVHADLEGMGYAFGGIAFPAAGIGAPHIRDRTYWVADSGSAGSLPSALAGIHSGEDGTRSRHGELERPRANGGLGHANGARLEGHAGDGGAAGREGPERPTASAGVPVRMANAANIGQHGRRSSEASDGRDASRVEPQRLCDAGERPGPTNGFWRAADWLACTDGKWRPVIATHVALVDGLSGTMGSLRPERKIQEKVSNHAASSHSNADQSLPSMRRSTETQNDQRKARGSRDFHASDLLQSAVHGEGHGQGSLHQPESHADESAPASEASMPSMREYGKAPRPPSGREPFQQFAVELNDIVSLLPPSIALATNDGRWRDLEALRALCKAICEAGFVQYAPEQAQAIWASLGEEAKDRIRLGFDVRAWRKLVFSPLSVGESSRVGRLRAYGNAIVPQAAAEFVIAFMQSAQRAALLDAA